MSRRVIVLFTGIILLFGMAGCDSFSLLSQFEKSDSTQLNLISEKNTINPGEETVLSPQGGTGPYSLTVIAANLYDAGYAADPGTIRDYIYTAGNSIGTVGIILTDSTGSSVNTTLTIQPWPPQAFTVNPFAGGPMDIGLSWTYNQPGYIEGFRILRSTAGGPFVVIADTGSLQRNYMDSVADPFDNSYSLYVVAGPYLSTYAEDGDHEHH